MRRAFDSKISNDISIMDQRVSRGDIKNFRRTMLCLVASGIRDGSYSPSEELFAIYGS